MVAYYHLTNMRTPFDTPSQDQLMILGDYKISLPIEADPTPDITPVPQATMIQNGIVGLYVPPSASEIEGMSAHWPLGLTHLSSRPSINTSDQKPTDMDILLAERGTYQV